MGKILLDSILFSEVNGLKKKIFVLMSFLFIFAITLFGCGGILLSGGPDIKETVYGNGGSAVVKGDYLYFANAFIDYNDLGINDNKYDQKSPQKIYGIYRTKLDKYGKVSLNEDGSPANVDLLSYKIGGYAYSGLYIFGDYLYYTTPYSQDNKGGTTVKGLVRLERVKLNGSGHEELFSVENYSSSSSYSLINIGSSVYFTYLDSNKNLNVLKVTGGNKDSFKVDSSVSSFKIYDQKDIVYGQEVQDINKYVYYVVNDSENSTYTFYKKDLTNLNSEPIVVLNSRSDEIKVIAVKNNRVYYTVNNLLYSFSNSNDDIIKYSQIPVSNSTDSSSSSSSLSSYQILDMSYGANLDRGIIGVYYNGLTYSIAIYDGITIKKLDILDDNTKKVTILGTQNNEFYYQIEEDNALYKCVFNLTYINNKFELNVNESDKKIKIADNFSTTVNEVQMLDFDSERIYVYESVDSSSINYLTMYMTADSYINEDGNIYGQYIGVLN